MKNKWSRNEIKKIYQRISHKECKHKKDSTIQLVINSNKSAYQIAQDLDINDKTLYSWMKAYKKVVKRSAKLGSIKIKKSYI
ncbi:MAG: hypothetical protein ACEQSQ_12180 [Candidatus Paceibacteria bacterium]